MHDVAPVFSQQVQRKRDEVDTEVLRRIEDISSWLAQARAPSFYWERNYGEKDAQQAFQDAMFVFDEVQTILEY
ncbi:MAG: hypothetical protein MAG451_03196 [Anaerolineales bacterium]|nr:hypothetical protein [Anaerolineales bacterium]